MSYPEQPTGDAAQASVLHWRDGGVAQLRFNRPRALNAIDRAMASAFLRACADIADDAAVRCVLLSGEGRAFMAGGDLAEMRTDPESVANALISGMHGGIRLLGELNAPVVAAVHGAVAGGGLGLVLNCDLVLAAQGTRFGVAYPLIGASCDCSTSWGLPRVVGLKKATELALLAETFEADEALRMGFVNRVVPAAQLMAEAAALAERLAQGPTRAMGQLKRLLRASLRNDLDTHLDAEAEGFLACATSSDFREGVEAFLDKRTPRFTGN
jgi:2-(1,2-epoxy-1,2-dihydrophenyl)acetyl-CoA isomerase